MTSVLVTHFICGFICMVAVWIGDMRNKPFDRDYFDMGMIMISLIVLIGGYISLIILFYVYCYNHRPFTKIIYKIANIGIKKEK